MPAPRDAFRNAFAITPNDGVDLPAAITGLLATVGGTVTVDMSGNGVNITMSFAAGVIHRLAAKKVYATGTAATGLIGYY